MLELKDPIVSGVISGFMASLFFFLFTIWIFRPPVVFSRDIRVVFLPRQNRFRYSIQIRKRGPVDLVDTKIKCRLAVKDSSRSINTWTYYDIPTTFEESLVVKRGNRIVDLSFHAKEFADGKKSVNLRRNTDVLYPEIGVRPEDIFVTFDNVFLKIYFIGHDKIAGMKRVYESNPYYIYNFVHGYWDGIDVRRAKLPNTV